MNPKMMPVRVGISVVLSVCCAPAFAQPCDPAFLGSVELAEDPGGVAIADTHSFVAAGDDGVRVIDTQNPALPAIVATLDTPGYAYDVLVHGEMLIVADGDAGVALYSTDNLPNASFVGSFSFPDSTEIEIVALAGHAQFVYVVDSKSGLKILDISDPASPQLVGEDPDTPDPQLRASKIDLAHGVAAVTFIRFNPNADPGVRLYNAVNPQSPTPVGWLQTPGEPSALALAGSTMFVADFINASVSSYDILDASSPVLLDTVEVAQVVDLASSGNELYVQTKNDGFIVYGALNPDALEELGSVETAGNARCLSVSGGVVNSADGGINVPFDRVAGVSIVDITSCESSVCAPDLFADGVLDAFDVFGFISAFNAGDPVADFTGDGLFDVFDVFEFIGAFNAGCV